MPIKLSTPLVEDFILEKSDTELKNNGEPSRVTIRQATQGDRERRDKVLYAFERKFKSDNEIEVTQKVAYDDVIRTEVMLTLASCNIDNMDGKPLFTFEDGRVKSEREFEKAWASLPPIVADEISEKVHIVNILWTESGK